MSFRSYIQFLQERGRLVNTKPPISKEYEVAGVLKALEPKPALFEAINESELQIILACPQPRSSLCSRGRSKKDLSQCWLKKPHARK